MGHLGQSNISSPSLFVYIFNIPHEPETTVYSIIKRDNTTARPKLRLMLLRQGSVLPAPTVERRITSSSSMSVAVTQTRKKPSRSTDLLAERAVGYRRKPACRLAFDIVPVCSVPFASSVWRSSSRPSSIVEKCRELCQDVGVITSTIGR